MKKTFKFIFLTILAICLKFSIQQDETEVPKGEEKFEDVLMKNKLLACTNLAKARLAKDEVFI
jgi:hypothetical protein